MDINWGWAITWVLLLRSFLRTLDEWLTPLVVDSTRKVILFVVALILALGASALFRIDLITPLGVADPSPMAIVIGSGILLLAGAFGVNLVATASRDRALPALAEVVRRQ